EERGRRSRRSAPSRVGDAPGGPPPPPPCPSDRRARIAKVPPSTWEAPGDPGAAGPGPGGSRLRAGLAGRSWPAPRDEPTSRLANRPARRVTAANHGATPDRDHAFAAAVAVRHPAPEPDAHPDPDANTAAGSLLGRRGALP